MATMPDSGISRIRFSAFDQSFRDPSRNVWFETICVFVSSNRPGGPDSGRKTTHQKSQKGSIPLEHVAESPLDNSSKNPLDITITITTITAITVTTITITTIPIVITSINNYNYDHCYHLLFASDMRPREFIIRTQYY